MATRSTKIAYVLLCRESEFLLELELYFKTTGLRAQLDALHPTIATTTNAVNARGETVMESLQDIPVRVREIALHGVRSGAADALAYAQLRHGA